MQVMKRFWLDESGQGMVEYGLILSLVAVAALVALTGLGTRLAGLFTALTNRFVDPPAPPAGP